MQDFDFILLLNRRFSGEITPAESRKLEAWLSLSPENEQIAAEYRRVWEHAAQQDKAFDLNLDAEFQRLLAQLEVPERPAARVVPMWRRVLRVAAALALLAAATWTFRELAISDAPTMLVERIEDADKRLIELPDGSKVWLRKHARLHYPAQFAKQERRVRLSGEAYFEVAHRTEQPFRVELERGGLVEVLGTQFNVRTTDQNDETCVLVREGRVRFFPDGQGAGTVLSAKDKAVYGKPGEPLVLSKVATFNELAWQSDQLEFDSTPLTHVLADLGKHYGVQIELANSALRNCSYSALLYDDLPIDSVVEDLAVIYRFQVARPAAGRYRLTGGVCPK